METLNEFTERFSEATGCWWGPLKNRNHLKKAQAKTGRGKNVLGWIREFPKNYPGWFRVSTYAEWADNKDEADAYEKIPLMHFNKNDGLVYWIKNESNGPDFQKAARAVTSVRNNPEFWFRKFDGSSR